MELSSEINPTIPAETCFSTYIPSIILQENKQPEFSFKPVSWYKSVLKNEKWMFKILPEGSENIHPP